MPAWEAAMAGDRLLRRSDLLIGLAIGTMFLAGGGCRPSADANFERSAKTFDGSSASLRETVVVPTLDSPLPRNKSAIWCISFQLAWNTLASDIVGGPVHIENAAAISERLNRAAGTPADVSPDMVYTAAGLLSTTQPVIEAEMRQRFPHASLPSLLAPPEGALIAFAYLRGDVRFSRPFLMNPEEMVFTDDRGRATSVKSFGIPKSNHEVPRELREQVRVLYLSLMGEDVREWALDLCKDSEPNQVVLARVERRDSLADILADLQNKIERFQTERALGRSPLEDTFDYNDRLLIPHMHWRVEHHYAELEGLDKIIDCRRFGDPYVYMALQAIDFVLDPNGSSVSSTAQVIAGGHPSRRFIADRPFLVYLKRRDAQHPFFVMWVDNAELLSRWQ
jgi:hypothetical protein